MDLGSSNFRFRDMYSKTLNTSDIITSTIETSAIFSENVEASMINAGRIYAGRIYTTQSFVRNMSSLSDARYKENVEDLTGAESALMALRPVSFDFIITDSLQDASGMKNKVGFLAQELKKVLPDLVSYLPEVDMYMVDYVSIILYLVQAYQEEKTEKEELSRQVAYLQQQVTELQDLVQSLLALQNSQNPARSPQRGAESEQPQENRLSAKLFQNIPNPFSERTVIRYELPHASGKAVILICDVKGKTVKNISLPRLQGLGQIEISGGELMPGIYTYSLVVEGSVEDTKRMVVTE